jgi:hypothetical protein
MPVLKRFTPYWFSVTKTFTDFSTAAATNSIALFTLPAGGVIHRIKVKHSTAFSGGTISAYNVSVGITGNTTKYTPIFDVFQATGNTAEQLTRVDLQENHGATTSVLATANSTGANLNAATAGSVTFWIQVTEAI